MRFNLKLHASFLGLLWIINGLLMLACLPVAWYYAEDTVMALAAAATITVAIGAAARSYGRGGTKDLRRRDGFLIVTLGWLSMSLFGCLPFLLSGAIADPTDAWFETVSGFTTTGATILNDIEVLPKSILFWRSLTHWIGGMGIIVLAIAILPLLGIGGTELFAAEASGLSTDKLHPRITGTAKRLWFVYVLLTGIEMVLLYLGGMGVYDAVNHSMSTISTGGFSTKNTSLADATPYIQYVVTVFMMVGGTNFALLYLLFKGRPGRLFRNEEFRTYALIFGLATVLVTLTVLWVTDTGLEKAFRHAVFQVAAIMTTTGFTTADYTAWTPFLSLVFLLLMFVSACAGSTAGGLKIVRHVVLFKNTFLEIKRQLYRSAVFPLRMNGRTVPSNVISNVLAFFVAYMMVFAIGTVVLAFLGLDTESAIGGVAACLSNVGPGLGSVGPSSSYAEVHDAGKWVLSVLMLLGRLELFTILVILTPHFWRRI